MKLNDAINFLNTQKMFRSPVARDRFNFLTKSQFDKLRASGLIKSETHTEASAKTGWKFVQATYYYVEPVLKN